MNLEWTQATFHANPDTWLAAVEKQLEIDESIRPDDTINPLLTRVAIHVAPMIDYLLTLPTALGNIKEVPGIITCEIKNIDKISRIVEDKKKIKISFKTVDEVRNSPNEEYILPTLSRINFKTVFFLEVGVWVNRQFRTRTVTVPYNEKWPKVETYNMPTIILGCGYCHVKNDAIKVCSRCKITRYCCQECQKNDYNRHKSDCLQIALYSI